MAEKKRVITYGIDDFGMLGFKALSFVDMPAIEVDFVHLKKQGFVQMKAVEEQRMVYGPVLIPEKLILRIDENDGSEFYANFPAETIRSVAHRMMEQGLQGKHTVMHEVEVDGCYIVQSWLKEYDQDKSNALGFDLPVGTWFVGTHVKNDAVWQGVKDGTFKGWSIEAFFKDIGEENLLAEVRKLLEA